MDESDAATIHALRRDVALQIARRLAALQLTQTAAAQRLGIPQPTVSKIANGRVDDLSLELLIRTAVRAGLPLVMQTGNGPQEAGAYVSRPAPRAAQRTHAVQPSRLATQARAELAESAWRLTPTQRLEAMLEQTQLVTALHAAGRRP
jgi:predicted XRE-type DNA-binding protein